MGDDLLSIAFSSSSNSMLSSSLGLDFHGLGVFNADMSQYMDCVSPPCEDSSLEADFSTGYLQDVLSEFSSKRRRLLMFSHDQRTELDSRTTKSEDRITDVKSPGEEISETSDSSSSSLKESADNCQRTTPDQKGDLYCIDTTFSSEADERREKRVLSKVVYPFAMVKPGGLEGDVTLNDINQRILMPPTRPVRHPVGDFACRPLASPEGRGLSGKAVVAFTRIHTQGRGTVTIIRTRG